MHVVKSLKEEELETTNSDKSGNKSVSADSVKWFDLEEPNYTKPKRTKEHPKPTPKQRSR